MNRRNLNPLTQYREIDSKMQIQAILDIIRYQLIVQLIKQEPEAK